MYAFLWIWRPLITLGLAGMCIYQYFKVQDAYQTVRDAKQEIEHARGMIQDADRAVNTARELLKRRLRDCMDGEKQL